uniref:Uncharacterized protein n=1 Tax=Panagrolaimus sp. PS1159 TaxID=55785 RepID=A0AC35EU43_9BILA
EISPRGISMVFGPTAIDEFFSNLGIELIVRGHQAVQEGYEFSADKKCLTIFSAPAYCGEQDNLAGILAISKNLECTIYTFKGVGKNPATVPQAGGSGGGGQEKEVAVVPVVNSPTTATTPQPTAQSPGTATPAKNDLKGLHTCPECSALIDPEKLKLDKEFHHRIQRLSVQCPFFDNGCEWKGELKELEGHALSCEKADIICPNGCGTIYPKSEEFKHLEIECSKKVQLCPNCSKSITVKSLKGHLKICPEAIIDCPNSCGLLQKPRNEISQHLSECPKAGSGCPFSEFGCEYTGGRENLQKHIKSDSIKHLSLLCDNVLELKIHLIELELNSERIIRNNEILTKKVKNLEKTYGPQMIWKIDSMKKRIHLAESLEEPIIYSSTFLSGRHGYRMVLSACLNGSDENTRGKKLSLFVTILKGENDAILPWPFTHRITLTLMDQNHDFKKRQHFSFMITPYASIETEVYIGRPKSEQNAAFGSKDFCDLPFMHNFIKDDTMFIKCNIDTENMVLL